MTVPTSDERREVAAKLRELASENQGTLGSMRKMQEVMTQAQKITGTMHLPSVAHVLERYADLIEPEERTCKIDCVTPFEFGEYSAVAGYVFSLSCDHYVLRPYKDEPPKYCDECGARVVSGDASGK